MEHTKEELFSSRYSSVNTLKIKRNFFEKIKLKYKTNKILSISVLSFFMLSIINIIMIHNFFIILEHI